MRVVLSQEPFNHKQEGWFVTGRWPASWIAHPDVSLTEPSVVLYRLLITIHERRTIRFHVSADQRYALFLDGNQLGRGPERGDVSFWHYESYDIDLPVGQHTLYAEVSWLGDMAPIAQMTFRPGFLLAAEAEDPDAFNTGHADWQVKRIDAYSMKPHAEKIGDFNSFTGPAFTVDGARMDWDVETSQDSRWMRPVSVLPAHNKSHAYDWIYGWTMSPAMLPAMLSIPRQIGTARHVDALIEETSENRIVEAANNLPSEALLWDALLADHGEIVVPARTNRRIIIDLENYYCAYPELQVSGGTGATVIMQWAESLYVANDYPNKGNRDIIDKRQFVGFGDRFFPDGGAHRLFAPLWWRAGRYVELRVITQEEPLTIHSLVFDETRYPFAITYSLACSDPRFSEIAALCQRAMETGSHETYMDCPYYEQLMYVGDSRIEALITHVMTNDARLPRKSLAMFDQSRSVTGLTASRYPSRQGQIIPPFSLFWVAMLHDFALWRNDEPYVRSMMPGVRSVMEAYIGCLSRDGLVQAPRGWNFMDWVAAWPDGIPPDGQEGFSSILNWQLVYVLKMAAELEQWYGDPRLAARLSDTASSMITPLMAAFYDDEQGLIADNLKHTRWSEHVQCLALLSGKLPEEQAARIGRQLCQSPNLERATIYFSHYLFETYRQLRRIDLVFERLALWFTLKDMGLKTTIEQPEPSRSDNHGWGAHPLYHYFASILGIRPIAPGFSKVAVEPQLGPLTWAKGTMPHPLGQIEVSVSSANGTLSGAIVLPAGLSGSLYRDGTVIELSSGTQTF